MADYLGFLLSLGITIGMLIKERGMEASILSVGLAIGFTAMGLSLVLSGGNTLMYLLIFFVLIALACGAIHLCLPTSPKRIRRMRDRQYIRTIKAMRDGNIIENEHSRWFRNYLAQHPEDPGAKILFGSKESRHEQQR